MYSRAHQVGQHRVSGAGLGSETCPVGFLPSSGPCGLQAPVCAIERNTGQAWHVETRGVDGCMPAALPPSLLWTCSGTTGWPHKAGPRRALSICSAVVPAEWGGHALGGSPFPPGGEGVRESAVMACSSPMTTRGASLGRGCKGPIFVTCTGQQFPQEGGRGGATVLAGLCPLEAALSWP